MENTSPPKKTTNTERLAVLKKWLSEQIDSSIHIESLAGDASHRQYYRLSLAENPKEAMTPGTRVPRSKSWVLMDAPPPLEDIRPFCRIAKILLAQGLSVPQIWAQQEEEGFLLLSDFGDSIYYNLLTAQTALPIQQVLGLYQAALQALLVLQKTPGSLESEEGWSWPIFDLKEYRRECGLFSQWFMQALLGAPLSPLEDAWLEQLARLSEHYTQQYPMVLVHRDYHSRNLIRLEGGAEYGVESVGILDFQDALMGSIVYDPVSLLKDCYIQYPRAQVLEFLAFFWKNSAIVQQASIPWGEFVYIFDLIGLQRHIKVCGIFARLALRDGKRRYLEDIPRILSYIQEVHALYAHAQAPEDQDFWRAGALFLNEKILPEWARYQERMACAR